MTQQTVVVDIALLGKMAGYIEMLVKDPYSTVFASLSDIYRTFGLNEEAVAVAQKGIEMVPTYAPGFVALGRALAEKGDPSAACKAYRQALELDSANISALTGLASACLGCGQNAEALALLTQAQLLSPDDEVVKQLFPVIKKLTDVPAVSLPLAPALTAPTSEVLSAIDEEQSYPEVNAASLPPIATATLADIYIKQGLFERALKVFSDLLTADPENLEIRQRHAELMQKVNSSVLTTTPEAVMTETLELKPPKNSVVLDKGDGKEALLAIYARWLDAIHRRRADVH